MPITRRQFLKRGAVSAAALTLGPRFRWMPGTNVSWATGPSDAIVVFVRQYGGNDGINTVYPLTNTASHQQRKNYTDFRPTLKLPATTAEFDPAFVTQFGTSTVLDLGANVDGCHYALHPAMTGLYDLHTQGKCAVVNGVHYPYADHSHFRSEAIWYTVDPLGTGGIGWFGRYLDRCKTIAGSCTGGFGSSEVPGVMLENDLIPLFTPTNTGLFVFTRLSELRFPASGELAKKQAAFNALYQASGGLDPSTFPELFSMGNTGVATLAHIDDYYKPGSDQGTVEALLVDSDGNYDPDNPLVYPSQLNPGDNQRVAGLGLARDLKHVAAVIRSNVGARFFHVSTGGFDTHSNQENGLFHSQLLFEVSESIKAFYDELAQTPSLPAGYSGYDATDLSGKVIIITFTEFGRTIRQNAPGKNTAGTDHATATPQFVVGGAVLGGSSFFGSAANAYPQLDDPGDNEDDLKMTFDFRDYFGTVLTRWLGVPVSDLGPGPTKIFPTTTPADDLGNSYTTFTPIGFLAP